MGRIAFCRFSEITFGRCSNKSQNGFHLRTLSPATTQLIREIASDARGAEPERVEQLHSVCNDVYRLTFPSHAPAILKVYARGHGADRGKRGDRSQVERAAIEFLALRGLPVPPIEAAGEQNETPWLLMTDVGSHAAEKVDDLPAATAELIHRTCGELFARLHNLPIDSTVPVDIPSARHSQKTTPPRPLDPVLRWALGRIEKNHRASPDQIAIMRAAACATRASIAFCHGDFHPGQCVRSGSVVTAMVDWESATLGDPVSDYAKLANFLHVYFAPPLAASTLAGYASLRTPPLDHDPHYIALRAIHAIALRPDKPDGADKYGRAWFALAEDLDQSFTKIAEGGSHR